MLAYRGVERIGCSSQSLQYMHKGDQPGYRATKGSRPCLVLLDKRCHGLCPDEESVTMMTYHFVLLLASPVHEQATCVLHGLVWPIWTLEATVL